MTIPAQKKFRGFTLIELLIVIAILGILAAAVLVAVNPAKRQNQAKDAQIKSDIGQIATALQAYFTAPGAGSYPDTLQRLVDNKDLVRLPTPPAGGSGSGVYTGSNFAVAPGACSPSGTLCTSARVMYDLLDPDTAGNVWCWESNTGTAAQVAPAACTAP